LYASFPIRQEYSILLLLSVRGVVFTALLTPYRRLLHTSLT
jgi:hypothetical protein